MMHQMRTNFFAECVLSTKKKNNKQKGSWNVKVILNKGLRHVCNMLCRQDDITQHRLGLKLDKSFETKPVCREW